MNSVRNSFVNLYILKVDINDDIIFNYFSKNEQKCILSKHNKKDQLLSSGEFILLKYLKVNSITKNEFGKPSSANTNLSISHSFPYVVVAISIENVGVDIEKKIKFDSKLKDVCFTSKEQKQNIDSTKLWTIKEASYKLYGNTSFEPLKYEIEITSNDQLLCNGLYIYYQTIGIDEYLLSITLEKKNIIKTYKLDYADLIKKI